MAGSIKYGGSFYQTLRQAAKACAADMLPETDVVSREENTDEAARELEGFCWSQQCSLYGEPPTVFAEDDYGPEGESVSTWRKLVREELEVRINASRPRVES